MKAFGYLEERDFVVEWRFAEWKYENLSDLALELVHSKVDVIVATTGIAVEAAQDATTTVPIVMAVSVDPAERDWLRVSHAPATTPPGCRKPCEIGSRQPISSQYSK